MDKELKLKIFQLLQQLSEIQENENENKLKDEQNSQRTATRQEKPKKVKKKIRYLFEHPFFELPRGQRYNIGRTVIARCRTCGAFMRGTMKVMSIFIKHMKVAHPDKYEMYIQWRNNETSSLQRLPQESINTETSNSSEVIVIEDDVEIKEEDFSKSDESRSLISDMTIDESTTKLISELLDEKLTPLMKNENLTNAAYFKSALNNLTNEVQELRRQLKHSESERQLLEQEIQSLEREVQRHSILVREIPFDEKKDIPAITINWLLTNILGVTNVTLEKVEVLPNTRNLTTNIARIPRSLIVTFHDPKSAEYVLSQSFKLRNSGIFIEPIITQNALKRKLKMLNLRRELMRRDPTIKAYVSGTKLFLGGYCFEWSILNYLVIVGRTNKTAFECLFEATGLDLTTFLNTLAT